MPDQLMRLSDLDDFEVADENPDVRGWKVVGSDGQHLGEVDELIVDPALMKVRYLEVEVREHFQGGHALVPIGLAVVDKADEIVFLNGCDTQAIEQYPRYSGEAITRDYEVSLRRALVPGVEAVPETDFYVHESFDEDRFYARRKAVDTPAGMSASPRQPSSAIRKRNITGEETRLRRLSDLKDLEIAHEQPDVRGWDVVDAAGKKVARVEDLIVEPATAKIRYLELSTGLIGTRHFLLPVGAAELDIAEDTVRLAGIDSNSIRRIPTYRGGPLTRDYELAVHKAFFPGRFCKSERRIS